MGKKGRENAPQTDSREWLIDTIKVTDKENNVGDYWSSTTSTKASGTLPLEKKSFTRQMC